MAEGDLIELESALGRTLAVVAALCETLALESEVAAPLAAASALHIERLE